MTAIFLAPVYLGLLLYLLLRLFHWLASFHRRLASRVFRGVLGAGFLLLALTPLGGCLISAGPLHRLLRIVSNFWLGMLLYILLIVGLADILAFVIRKVYQRRGRPFDRRKFCRRAGSLAAAAILLVSAGGLLHAYDIRVHREVLTVDKACRLPGLRVALIADLHLGYSVGASAMEQMVEKINREQPDIVCLAGDIFDNEFEAIHEPQRVAAILRKIESRYGVYACWGNHDVKERVLAGFTFRDKKAKEEDPRFLAFFQQAGITLLEDESLLIDNAFYLAGRKDYSKSRKMQEERLTPAALTAGLDRDKPILVMDHQPKELAALAAAGVDVDLSGHTHGGQVFPGNLLVPLVWENPVGIRVKDGMYSCVTSGVGVWGPAMRVGTDSEILILDIRFAG